MIYSLGLALSGGSVKGFAHLGVLEYLDEVGVRPEIIAGTSAGSLVGALYADGYHPREIFELLSDLSLMEMTSFSLSSGGLLGTDRFVRFLREHLRHKRIEDLPIPLRIVATDLDHGCQHVFTHGELPRCIMASCCIPVLFRPIEIEGIHYVDGGLFRNFPVSVIRSECAFIIGMNLGPEEGVEYKKTLTGVADRAWKLVFRQNTLPDKEVCDLLLETSDVLGYGMFEVEAASKLMQIGYRLAKNKLTHQQIQQWKRDSAS